MRYKITGRNINVTQGLKAAVEEKIGKLERYFNQDTEAIITLSVEKERQKIEVTIPVKGTIIRAEQESNDMYVSIDLVEEIIERQLKKYKNKIIDKKQAAVAFSDLFINEEYDSSDEIEIVKVKKFAMKPMDPEEACVQMELLGHAFYVFLNSETEQVNVVYKRKGNTYGKKFAMKPMDPEEACVQMELLGHAFYVFLNSETEQVNVVYKRKGNTYGLIEPEF